MTQMFHGSVKFPAVQEASIDANTLDDYEEGSWTPSVGGDATYVTQVGTYIKIGQMVTVWGQIEINVLGTGSKRVVSGLPFTSANIAGVEYLGAVGYFVLLATSVVNIVPQVGGGATTIDFMCLTAAASGTSAVDIFKNGARIYFSCTYRAAN